MFSKEINQKHSLKLITINKFLFYLIIISIIISPVLNKSIHVFTNSEQKITLSLLQGECTLIPCGDSFCSTSGGICENTESGKVCKCKEGYTTPEEDEFYNCCYKQKSSLIAFILEACLFFGIGHFYVGNKKIGITKAIIYGILLIFSLIICCRRFFRKNRYVSDSSIITRIFKIFCILACGCTFIIWQMIDSVMFNIGGYTDDKGVKLS